jgi:hypothetical protein
MAANMGSHQRRFIDMYSDQADDIQRKLLEYTKLLQHPNELAVPSNRPDLDIQTENGFPLMPPLMENIEQKKDELEELLRRYLNAHYSKFIFILPVECIMGTYRRNRLGL